MTKKFNRYTAFGFDRRTPPDRLPFQEPAAKDWDEAFKAYFEAKKKRRERDCKAKGSKE